MDNLQPYCIAAVGHDGEPKTQLTTFDEVTSHLRQTYSLLVNEYADARINEDPVPESPPVGGFGVWLRNRWGGEIEIGVGRDVWFLVRLKPQPTKIYSDSPELSGRLAFYIAGGHYTDFDSRHLTSREEALRILRRWLDEGTFPDQPR